MFFAKVILWICVIIALLPSNTNADYSVYNITTSTFRDLGNFCTRNPDTCNQGGAIASHLQDKAYNAGQILVSMISTSYTKNASLDQSEITEPQPRPQSKPASTQPTVPAQRAKRNFATYVPPPRTQMGRITAPTASQNTLKADDLENDWLGPAQDVGI
ncbi:MAG: DUF5330 domain-containing protein [Pseudomonadota bacterium]